MNQQNFIVPHESHEMTSWKQAVTWISETGRSGKTGMARYCRNCGATQIENNDGDYADPTLSKVCADNLGPQS